jgi:hypothetical protein
VVLPAIVTGLTAWFEHTDNTLEAAAAAADDADEDDPEDSDYNKSDYNSIDAAERDAQEDDDNEGKSQSNNQSAPPTSGIISFEAISIRVGLIAKKSSTETQDTTQRSSQASNVHPSLSGSNGRPLTRSGSNDARNCTTKRTGFW